MHLQKKMAALAAGLLMSLGATAETYRWDNVAMGGGGFVSAVVASKSERGVVFARTDVGGAYRWDGQNGRWQALTDWMPESMSGLMGVESLAIDPRNAANVYMLAGTDYASNGKTAIMRSTDYGKHFEIIDVTAQFKAHGNGMGRSNGERLQVDPGAGNVLYAGTRHDGLFRSTDSGATWNRLNGLNVTNTPNGNGISFVLLDPASVGNGAAKRIFVGVSRYGSVGPNLYFSKDGGATFAPVAGAPAGLMPQRAAITPKGRLYLTYANGAGPHGSQTLANEPMDSGQIWEYNTVGGAWTNVTPAGMGTAFGGISVDPANPKRLVASTINAYWTQQQEPVTYGDRIFTSLDAGRTWTDVVDRGLKIDPNGIEWARKQSIHWAGSIEFDPFDPKTVWVVSGNGVFKTSDIDAPTSTWKFDVLGMEETGSYGGESIPGGPLMTVIGDYDGFLHTDPAQYGTRHEPAMGSTTGMAVAGVATQVLARVGNALYTSTNMGASWEQTPTLNGSRGRVALSADGYVLLHSPENSTTTYRSTDFGANWTAVAGLAVNNAYPVGDKVNPAKFYVYDRATGAVLVSTDGGVSFSPQAQLPTGGSTTVRATPGRDGDLWVCLDSKGLMHSTDSGASFAKLAPVGSCGMVGLGKAAPDASYPTLYMWGAVGPARGMLRSTDQGASWVRINDDAHQYGGPGTGYVNGDMNTYGMVYMSTTGRGSVYGKIDPNGGVQVVPQAPAVRPKAAECKYTVSGTGWWGGHNADITIKNNGTETINGWTVQWSYSDNSTVQGFWNAAVTGSSPTFTAMDNQDWNHDIAPGATVQFGITVGGQDGPTMASLPVVTGDICK